MSILIHQHLRFWQKQTLVPSSELVDHQVCAEPAISNFLGYALGLRPRPHTPEAHCTGRENFRKTVTAAISFFAHTAHCTCYRSVYLTALPACGLNHAHQGTPGPGKLRTTATATAALWFLQTPGVFARQLLVTFTGTFS